MQSPEVWNFKPPTHNLSKIKSANKDKEQAVNEDIKNHFFNHSVTVILPDTILIPEELNSPLVKDSVYYKASKFPVRNFLDVKFINSFVKLGHLTALSVGTQIDTDDCAAVTPSGVLILNLNKETFQTLGLEGAQSRFSTERYVVKIDLKQPCFIPGKKNYERAVKCLTELVDLQMDFLLSWEPPDWTEMELEICPSSLAAHLVSLGCDVSECTPQVASSRQYNARLPDIRNTDSHELLEWLGAVALGVEVKGKGAEQNYLSSYIGPMEISRKCQVAVLKHSGFFTTKQIEQLFNKLKDYVQNRKDLEYIAVHVQGFSDSPVTWGCQEHTFQSDGDNSYTVLLQADDTASVYRHNCQPKKIKHKLG